MPEGAAPGLENHERSPLLRYYVRMPVNLTTLWVKLFRLRESLDETFKGRRHLATRLLQRTAIINDFIHQGQPGLHRRLSAQPCQRLIAAQAIALYQARQLLLFRANHHPLALAELP